MSQNYMPDNQALILSVTFIQVADYPLLAMKIEESGRLVGVGAHIC